MHYFITGHTGFKGSWLILLLKELGHEVSGYSLPPVKDGLFELANLETELRHHFVGDVRDKKHLAAAIKDSAPDFAIHMAAQPLVLRSYEDPIETYTTNVDGTLNFLEAISALVNPPVSLVVTTDKVYRDDGKRSYVETDPLGGHDPYSASKAMADILTQSWAVTNPHLNLHVARAGNVIGAFDVSENRLVPDVVRAIKNRKKLISRNPSSIRPWQHVLDCLHGYLLFLDHANSHAKSPLVLNFGPDSESVRSVLDLLNAVAESQAEFEFEFENSSDKAARKETSLLTLDSSFAEDALNWKNLIDFSDAVEMSVTDQGTEDPRSLVISQITQFLLTNGVRVHFGKVY